MSGRHGVMAVQAGNVSRYATTGRFWWQSKSTIHCAKKPDARCANAPRQVEQAGVDADQEIHLADCRDGLGKRPFSDPIDSLRRSRGDAGARARVDVIAKLHDYGSQSILHGVCELSPFLCGPFTDGPRWAGVNRDKGPPAGSNGGNRLRDPWGGVRRQPEPWLPVGGNHSDLRRKLIHEMAVAGICGHPLISKKKVEPGVVKARSHGPRCAADVCGDNRVNTPKHPYEGNELLPGRECNVRVGVLVSKGADSGLSTDNVTDASVAMEKDGSLPRRPSKQCSGN